MGIENNCTTLINVHHIYIGVRHIVTISNPHNCKRFIETNVRKELVMGLTSELAVSRALAILYEYSWEVKEIKREPNLLRQLRISLAALESALERLLYLLKDADEHARNGDEKLGDWVLEIAEIAFEVQDLVSELFAKMPSRKYLFKMEKETSCFSSSFF